MHWFFDGLGTMLVGFLLGLGADEGVRHMVNRKRLSQKQRAGHQATQLQAGRDINQGRRDRHDA